jgi:hypothetical protein
VSGEVRVADRRRDRAALFILLIGAALMLWAHFGMRALSRGDVVLEEGEWRMNRWNRYARTSNLGAGFVVAGMLIGVWSMTRYQFYRRAAKNAEKDSP